MYHRQMPIENKRWCWSLDPTGSIEYPSVAREAHCAGHCQPPSATFASKTNVEKGEAPQMYKSLNARCE